MSFTGNDTQRNPTCKFPFYWNGKYYDSCVFKKEGAWCSAKVDSNNAHVPGYWMECPDGFKVDKSPIKSSGRNLKQRDNSSKEVSKTEIDEIQTNKDDWEGIKRSKIKMQSYAFID